MENELLKWMGAIFGSALLLTVGVIAYDRCEMGFIDHMVDFHLDEDRVREYAENKRNQEAAKQENLDSWVRDVRDWGRDDRGTIGPPDRDK